MPGPLAQRVQPERRATQEASGRRESRASLVPSDQRGQQAWRGLLEASARKARLVPLEPLAHRDRQGRQEPRELKATLVPPEQLELLARRVTRA